MQNQPDASESLSNSHQNYTQMRKPLHRAILLSIPLGAALIGCVIGGLIGMIRYAQCPQGFESQSVFYVALNGALGDDSQAHHATRVSSRLMIQVCLARDGGKLRKLECFDDIPPDESADLMLRNLVVESLSDDGSIIAMRMLTANSSDAPTLLNNLAQTYEESLKRRETYQRNKEVNRLEAVAGQYRKRIEFLEGKPKSKETSALEFGSISPSRDKKVPGRIADADFELERARETFDSLELEIAMLKDSQDSRIVFERLENAMEPNGVTTRGSLNLVWNPALIGAVIGLLVGVILAFVVK